MDLLAVFSEKNVTDFSVLALPIIADLYLFNAVYVVRLLFSSGEYGVEWAYTVWKALGRPLGG